jgi:DNA repair exonuclease SbcCD ATPase subunit
MYENIILKMDSNDNGFISTIKKPSVYIPIIIFILLIVVSILLSMVMNFKKPAVLAVTAGSMYKERFGSGPEHESTTMQDASVQDLNMQSTTMQDPNMQSTTMQDPNMQSTTMQDSNASQDASAQDSNASQDASAQDSNTQDSNTQDCKDVCAKRANEGMFSSFLKYVGLKSNDITCDCNSNGSVNQSYKETEITESNVTDKGYGNDGYDYNNNVIVTDTITNIPVLLDGTNPDAQPESQPQDKPESPPQDAQQDKPESPQQDKPESPPQDAQQDKPDAQSQDKPESPPQDAQQDKPDAQSQDKPESPPQDAPQDKPESPPQDATQPAAMPVKTDDSSKKDELLSKLDSFLTAQQQTQVAPAPAQDQSKQLLKEYKKMQDKQDKKAEQQQQQAAQQALLLQQQQAAQQAAALQAQQQQQQAMMQMAPQMQAQMMQAQQQMMQQQQQQAAQQQYRQDQLDEQRADRQDERRRQQDKQRIRDDEKREKDQEKKRIEDEKREEKRIKDKEIKRLEEEKRMKDQKKKEEPHQTQEQNKQHQQLIDQLRNQQELHNKLLESMNNKLTAPVIPDPGHMYRPHGDPSDVTPSVYNIKVNKLYVDHNGQPHVPQDSTHVPVPQDSTHVPVPQDSTHVPHVPVPQDSTHLPHVPVPHVPQDSTHVPVDNFNALQSELSKYLQIIDEYIFTHMPTSYENYSHIISDLESNEMRASATDHTSDIIRSSLDDAKLAFIEAARYASSFTNDNKIHEFLEHVRVISTKLHNSMELRSTNVSLNGSSHTAYSLISLYLDDLRPTFVFKEKLMYIYNKGQVENIYRQGTALVKDIDGKICEVNSKIVFTKKGDHFKCKNGADLKRVDHADIQMLEQNINAFKTLLTQLTDLREERVKGLYSKINAILPNNDKTNCNRIFSKLDSMMMKYHEENSRDYIEAERVFRDLVSTLDKNKPNADYINKTCQRVNELSAKMNRELYVKPHISISKIEDSTIQDVVDILVHNRSHDSCITNVKMSKSLLSHLHGNGNMYKHSQFVGALIDILKGTKVSEKFSMSVGRVDRPPAREPCEIIIQLAEEIRNEDITRDWTTTSDPKEMQCKIKDLMPFTSLDSHEFNKHYNSVADDYNKHTKEHIQNSSVSELNPHIQLAGMELIKNMRDDNDIKSLKLKADHMFKLPKLNTKKLQHEIDLLLSKDGHKDPVLEPLLINCNKFMTDYEQLFKNGDPYTFKNEANKLFNLYHKDIYSHESKVNELLLESHQPSAPIKPKLVTTSSNVHLVQDCTNKIDEFKQDLGKENTEITHLGTVMSLIKDDIPTAPDTIKTKSKQALSLYKVVVNRLASLEHDYAILNNMISHQHTMGAYERLNNALIGHTTYVSNSVSGGNESIAQLCTKLSNDIVSKERLVSHLNGLIYEINPYIHSMKPGHMSVAQIEKEIKIISDEIISISKALRDKRYTDVRQIPILQEKLAQLEKELVTQKPREHNAALDHQIAELQARVAALERTLSEKEKEINDLHAKFDKSHKEHQHILTTIEAKLAEEKEALRKAHEQNAHLHGQHGTAQAKIEELEGKRKQLEGELKTLTDTHTLTAQQLQNLEREHKQKENELAKLKAEHDRAKQAHEKLIRELQAKHESNLQELQDKHGHDAGEHARLQVQAQKEHENQLQEVRREHEAKQQEQLKEHEAYVRALQDRHIKDNISALKTKQVDELNQIKAHQAKIAELEHAHIQEIEALKEQHATEQEGSRATSTEHEAQLNATIQRLEHEKAELEHTMKGDKEKYTNELTKLNTEKNALSERLKTSEDDFTKLKGSSSAEIHELKESVARLTLQLEEAKGEVELSSEKHSIQLTNVNNINKELSARVMSLQHDLTEHKNELVTCRSEIEHLKSIRTELEREKRSLHDQAKLLSQHGDNKDRTNIELNGEILKLKEQINTINTELMEAKRNILEHKGNIGVLKITKAESEERLALLKSSSDALKQTEIDQLTAKIKEDEHKINELNENIRTTLTTYNENAAKATAEKENLAKQLEKAEKKLSDKKNEIKTLKTELGSLNKNLNDIQNQLNGRITPEKAAELQRELDKLRAESNATKVSEILNKLVQNLVRNFKELTELTRTEKKDMGFSYGTFTGNPVISGDNNLNATLLRQRTKITDLLITGQNNLMSIVNNFKKECINKLNVANFEKVSNFEIWTTALNDKNSRDKLRELATKMTKLKDDFKTKLSVIQYYRLGYLIRDKKDEEKDYVCFLKEGTSQYNPRDPHSSAYVGVLTYSLDKNVPQISKQIARSDLVKNAFKPIKGIPTLSDILKEDENGKQVMVDNYVRNMQYFISTFGDVCINLRDTLQEFAPQLDWFANLFSVEKNMKETIDNMNAEDIKKLRLMDGNGRHAPAAPPRPATTKGRT